MWDPNVFSQPEKMSDSTFFWCGASDNGGQSNLVTFRFFWLKQLFRKEQRLQLGFSDSNRAQLAEYLKFGCTLLVLDMTEAGFLEGAPELKRPFAALEAINMDASLKTKVELRNGEWKTALEIQRFYLERAERFLKESSHVVMEHTETVRLWRETLDLLGEDPSRLLGRLDWVSKLYLLENAGADANFAARKKIDLAYHELGTGYFDMLEREGFAIRLVSEEQAQAALHEPPTPEKARMRSRWIRQVAFDDVKISWNSVRVGKFHKRKVVNLNDYRNSR